MDRRQFVQSMSAAGLSVPLAFRTDLSATRIDKIGLQLYTVRDAMKISVERTLAQVADIGYREVEFAGYFDRPPRAIRQLLDRNNLSSPSAHLGLDKLRGTWNRTLSDAAEIGHKWLVVASLDGPDRNSIDAIKRTADLFHKAAQDAKQYKIKLAFHNHDADFRLVEGRKAIDVLLESTTPDELQVELDLYWITKSGNDPLAYFAKYPGRFPLVHVKDAGPAPAMEMREVGQGTIDWAKIFVHQKEAGIKHFFVEHDNPADPMASIKTSFQYLKGLTY